MITARKGGFNDNAIPRELRNKGIKVLSDALGPADMARFLMQFDKGQGDYTKERHEWLDKVSIDEISEELRKKRESQGDE
jgi:uncharacterized protein YciU (UPF0263 family)